MINTIRNSLFAVFFTTLITVACAENTTASQLGQEDITNVKKLHSRYLAASSEDGQLASEMLTQANKAAKKNQWGKSAKLYGESILIKPSTDSLVGYAEANIYIKRQADSKTQKKQAKQRDFKYAAQVLETALQFSEKIGESGTNQNVQQRATQKLTCINKYLQSGSVDEKCQFIQEATE